MAFDPASSAAKWASRLGQSATDGTIQRGVQGVTQSPGQAAARQKNLWVQNTTQAADRWASKLASQSVGDWSGPMLEKGLPRISQGATAAQPKMATFLAKLQPVVQAAVANAGPRGDINANLARANKVAMALHQAKGSFT